jgi:heme/copper-type cytochrome/quinol oxidase subunit 3
MIYIILFILVVLIFFGIVFSVYETKRIDKHKKYKKMEKETFKDD